jgi:hypothetical protein
MAGLGAPAIPATGSGEGVRGVGEVRDRGRERTKLMAKAGTVGDNQKQQVIKSFFL